MKAQVLPNEYGFRPASETSQYNRTSLKSGGAISEITNPGGNTPGAKVPF